MVKATAIALQEEEEDTEQESGVGDFYFLAIPMETYRALEKESSRRGISLAGFLQQAIAKALDEKMES